MRSIVVSAMGVFLVAIQTQAQGPENDTCAGAVEIAMDASATGSTALAGDDAFAGCGAGMGGKDVVYRFTLTQPGAVTIDTVGSAFDTVLSVWTICSATGLNQEIACSDDFNGLTSRIDFAELAAGTYYILVDGANIDDSGNYVLNLRSPSPPANDDCGSARAVTVNTTVWGSTLGASDSGAHPIDGIPSDGPDVFYTFEASASGMRVDTLGSDLDTTIAVREGGCSGAVIGSNDDFGGARQSQLDLSGLTVGNTYVIQVDSAAGQAGTFRLTVSETMAAPPNDACSEALAALPIPSDVTGTTLFATNSTSPEGRPGDGPDVVFRVSVNESESLVLDTLGTEFDPVVYVRSGSCSGSEVVPSDDLFGRKPPRLTYSSLGAGDYFIFIDGETVADRGDFKLTVTAGVAPANDNCTSALAIGVPSTQVGSTEFAGDSTNATGENCNSNDNEVVFSFEIQQPTRLLFDTVGSLYDTVLYLRTGECSAETELACNNDFTGLGFLSRIDRYMAMPLPAGKYRIYVDGNEEAGPFVLNVMPVEVIPGDFNFDQVVDSKDLLILVEKSKEEFVDPNHVANLNGDDRVDGKDLWIFETLWHSR